MVARCAPLRGGAGVRGGGSCASDGRRVLSDIGLRWIGDGSSSIDLYRTVYLTMFASGSSIRMQKGANAKKLQGCEVGEMLCEVVTVVSAARVVVRVESRLVPR